MTTVDPAEASVSDLDVGDVFRTAWRITRDAPAQMLGAPLLVLALAWSVYAGASTIMFVAGAEGPLAFVLFAVMVVALLANELGFAILSAAASARLRGAPLSTRAAFGVALRRAPASLGAGLVEALAIGVGLVLLVVPGVLAAIVLSLGPTVCVAEGRGPLGALERSHALTEGRRFAVFLVLLLHGVVAFFTFFVAYGMSGVILFAMMSASSAPDGGYDIEPMMIPIIVMTAALGGFAALLGGIRRVLCAVVHARLAGVAESRPVDALEGIFR